MQDHQNAQLKPVEKVRIRFRFSDKIIVQANFSPYTCISDLFAFLREIIQDPSVDFALKVPPSAHFSSLDTRTLLEAHLSPATAFFVVDPVSLHVYRNILYII